jgi:diguanylate cyclase (GGDEF)-like protein
LTQAQVGSASHEPQGRSWLAGPPGLRRPDVQVVLLAVLMLLAASVLLALTPDLGNALEPSGWWAFVATAVLFGVAEYTVFNVQFRQEGIAFGLSEIPLAFALVFLSPPVALLARLIASVPVLVVARRNRGYKLIFNGSIILFELALAIVIFRGLNSLLDGGTSTLIACLVIALILVAPLTSILISVAISRFEGDVWNRVLGELRATWWMYTVNAVLAAMTVSLALYEPLLALLALLPAAGIWYVLRSYGEVSQELRDLDAVHGFAGHVGTTLDVDEIGTVAVEELLRLFRAEGAALVRFAPAGPIVHVAGQVSVPLPTDTTATGWRLLLEAKQVQLVSGPRINELGIDAVSGVPALLVAPIAEDDEVFALLVVVQQDSHVLKFDQGDIARLSNIAHQMSVSLRRGMLHERLEYEARHDALTGLPARTPFEREVGRAVEQAGPQQTSWVLMLDLDRFKEVNDTLGHHAGDDLLIQFSERMSSLLEPGDVLARLAGDEFAILCARESHDEIVEFAQACVAEGGRPVVLDGLEIVVTVSVGVAQISMDDHDAVQPMRRADIAMYNAKWQRTGVEFYRDEIDRRTPARLSMLGDLRTAIETDQLDVVYQPKLDLTTGRIVGVEALVRWMHPTRGVVAPSEFVRVAEDTGLIKQLTDLVLARGIRMLREFDEHGLDLGLAVNLSTHDLFDSRLPDRVRAHLEANGVPPSSLTLEITESSLFVDAPRTRATIDDLHAVGLRMAVDDFGTGYSSLSYLRRLPVHELKIDQSFVAGMLTDQQDEVIVRSTVDLGHNLGLLVVAEGVESLAILERLREVHCDVAQGYVISEPVLADQLIDWLHGAGDQPWLDSVG